MKQELKDRWVAALRSGEYIQGYGQLRSGSGRYCCLGVLWDIDQGRWVAMPLNGFGIQVPGGDLLWRMPPTDWTEGLGLGEEGLIDGGPESYVDYLVHLNDEKQQSFENIAAWIEGNIPVST